MAQERGTPAGYDWEGSPGAAGAEPAALPDHEVGGRHAPVETESGGPDGAPRVVEGAPADDATARSARSGRPLPPWAIVAIVAVQATAAVLCVVLVLGGLERLLGADPGAPSAAPSATDEPDPGQETTREREKGAVTDADGQEVEDGTGEYDRPATIGEHTFTWRSWTDGALEVTALEVDLAATLPASAGEDVLQEGYRLVSAHYEVRYEGPGQLAPVEELWLTGESDLSYFPDVADGLAADPVDEISPLGSGETARFHSLFVVPEAEVASFRLGVETFRGETLYYATS